MTKSDNQSTRHCSHECIEGVYGLFWVNATNLIMDMVPRHCCPMDRASQVLVVEVCKV